MLWQKKEFVMHKNSIIAAIIILALSTLACGIQVNLPVAQVKTGPLETEEIQILQPENSSTATDIRFSFGAGKLTLAPGSQEFLIEGQATYNVSDFKPSIQVSGNMVRMEQGSLHIQGIPRFDDTIRNEWDLQLSERPVSLKIDAGAYTGSYEFGGLAIEDLEINDGASDVNLSFNAPNLSEMRTFRYNTGASSVRLRGLGYANFAEMIFRGGAGSYSLDFSGELRRDALVSIDSGISSLEIIVPAGTNARLNFEGGLSNISARGEWRQSGSAYIVEGSGPTLEFSVKISAGSLELRTAP
jgi:hypothetical protein